MLAEILSIVTVGVVVAHLIKDIITDKRQKKIDEQKLQLEQSKVNVDLITKLPDILKSLFDNPLIKNPEELKTKIKEVKEAYKDFKIEDT
ncbi:hypothetical protein LCGC14_2241270 [marine sediment metagenome]|uniref:Uncharacterized protein n=1 Tax=marine sediment metagenome TaxID=412755 RepID=A0A0F9G0E8_9ZZZZ